MAGPREEGKDPCSPNDAVNLPCSMDPRPRMGSRGALLVWLGRCGVWEKEAGDSCVSVSSRVSRRLMGCSLQAHWRDPCPAQLLGEAVKHASDVGPQRILVQRPHALRWWMIYEEGSDSLTSAPAGLSGRFWSFYFISKSPDCPSP